MANFRKSLSGYINAEDIAENTSQDAKLFTEMKSIQSYTTKDEYLYAMKEDLAEWFNSMYLTEITAENFIDQLKNGVLICRHANCVMKEGAAKAFKFNVSDLNAVGIVNIENLIKTSAATGIAMSKPFSTPSGKSQFAGEFLLYNAAPKTQHYRAYDNVTNFINWCRFVVKVRDCLMFETEDLILCKNEKNFILCLLEVARFGSKFGIQVPTIIRLEQEIEAEIAIETSRLLEEKKTKESTVLSNLIKSEVQAEPPEMSDKTNLEIVEENQIENENEEFFVEINGKAKEDLKIDEEHDSFMQDFGFIDENSKNLIDSRQKLDSELNWSQTSSSKNEENAKVVDSNENESDPSYLNDSLEGLDHNHDGDDEDEEVNIKTHATDHNNSSCLNVDFSIRPERGDINSSVNNTITAVTLLNNLNNKNISSGEITSSLTSFSSLSSSEATNSNSNAENIKDHSSTTSPSSTTSSSPCKFKLHSPSDISLKENNNRQITIDCRIFEFDPNSSSLSTSSPKYVSSPSSSESTPKFKTNDNEIISAKVDPDYELTKEMNEIDNSNELIEINKSRNNQKESAPRSVKKRSAIPVYQNDLKPSATNTSLVEEPQCYSINNQFSRPSLPNQTITHQTKDLHNQVCSIANKCTCEKQFLVDKIGEGKYKIGNTKNVVFIRILRNHIMVRVGGGWDTLENYLNKHDPCRCGPENVFSKKPIPNHHHHNTIDPGLDSPIECQNSLKNILLTPIKSNYKTSANQPNITLTSPNSSNLNIPNRFTPKKPGVDFTNAHLIIERNNQGKHQVGKVILKSNSTQLLDEFNKNKLSTTLNDTCELHCDESSTSNIRNNLGIISSSNNTNSSQQTNAMKHNINNNQAAVATKYTIYNNNSVHSSVSNSIFVPKIDQLTNKINSTSQIPQKNESLLRNKMKKLINKLPTSSHSNSISISSPSSPVTSVRQKHNHKMVEPTTNPMYDRQKNEPANNSFYNNIAFTVRNPDSLLKFTPSNNTEPSTTGYSSYNEDSDFIESNSVSVYTETKLPPRLLRKYQKRAYTDLLMLDNDENSTTNSSADKNEEINQINQKSNNVNKCSNDTASETESGSGVFSSSGMGSPESKNEAFNDSKIISNSVNDIVTTSSLEIKKENSEKDKEPEEFDLELKTLELIEPVLQQEIKNPLPIKTVEKTSLISNSSIQTRPSPFSLINDFIEPKVFVDSKSDSPPLSPPVALKNTNPSPPPRLKMKYNKKSATTNLSNYIMRKVSDPDSLETDSIEENCLDKPVEDLTNLDQNTMSYLFKPFVPAIETSLTPDQISSGKGNIFSKNTDPNDSLEDETNIEEDMITRLVKLDHSELNREEDFLVAAEGVEIQQKNFEVINTKQSPKRAQWEKSNNLNFNKRAEWDKTRKEIDLMYFNFSMKSAQAVALRKKQQKTALVVEKSTLSSSKPVNLNNTPKQQIPKKTRNLNLAKEKLYEMKLNLDSINTSLTSGKSNNTTSAVTNSPSNIQRTTPRKVKKRSGEKSFTTGLFADPLRDKSSENFNRQRPKLNPTPLRSRSPFLATNNDKNKAKPNTNRTSSLHNIRDLLDESFNNNSTSRERTDSYSSNFSNCTIGGFSQPVYEYKETKSSELRKKAAIMNKIGTKGGHSDNFYLRNNQMPADSNPEKFNSSSCDQSNAARKRLFAKKSEKNMIYDPNVSMYSNSSSISSSDTTNSSLPTFSSMSSSRGNQRQSRPVKVFDHVQHNINVYSSNKASSKVCQPEKRSKSNTELYYKLERTNSEQDLIEVLSQCDAPKGDLSCYKIMMSETHKLEQHIKDLKLSSNRTQMPKRSEKSPSPTDAPKVSATDECFQLENSAIDEHLERLENEQSFIISLNEKNSSERLRSRSFPRNGMLDLPNLDKNGMPTKPMFNF